MSIQLTVAAGRNEAGAMTFSVSAGRKRRDEARAPQASRRAPERAKAKAPGRQRESLGRRMWRGARQSRAVAAARVAGGIGRDLLAATPLGQTIARIAASSRQHGRNVQQRWTAVRARQQALGRPTRTRQDRQISALKGQLTKAQRQIQALQAQLATAQQGAAPKAPAAASRGSAQAPKNGPPKQTGKTQPTTTPKQTGKTQATNTPKQAGTRTSNAQRGTKGKAPTTGKGKPNNRASSRSGGKQALQSRNGGKSATQAKPQRAKARGGR